MKALVVDDSRSMRAILTKQLRELGFTVVEFEEEVVDVRTRFDAAAQCPCDQFIGVQHQALAVTDQEGPRKKVRQRREIRHTCLTKMPSGLLDTTIVIRKNT